MTPQQYKVPFKLSTLALAVTATLPLTAVHAETEKELTTVEVHGQERSAYKVDKASSGFKAWCAAMPNDALFMT